MNLPYQIIPPDDLVPMDLFCEEFPITLFLAYKTPKLPNIFGEIYHKNSRLWLHKDLAKSTLLASRINFKTHKYNCVLYDGLRTIEAQERMAASDIARANPHWLKEPGRLLSPPGGGAHPRGMAIDLSLQTIEGQNLDMGTAFDYLAENSSVAHNPAHREHQDINEKAHVNRAILTDAMIQAAQMLNLPLLPLPQEWWDFRLPAEIYESYEPLSDANLPPQMRMTDAPVSSALKDFLPEHFTKIKQDLIKSIDQALPPT